MAVTYGFYDSLNHDRLYNAQQMSAIFDGIINDGVFMSVGNQFHTVAGTGMQVIVKSGRAWFDSTWTLNDAEYPLSIDAADVLLTRIDAVVLEVNSEVATRANTIKVVKGTPASTPAKPTLTNTATIHQHALAYVTVAKNTTAITNSMIEIVVGKTETPYVTAILQTTDITDLFKKWENDFQVWFETVKGTLDGDVALNLQNQIDHCVKKADKATAEDIEAGTADKWVDSALYKEKQFTIGDIKLTSSSNGDNNWMLMNDDIIPLNSDLYNLYKKNKRKYDDFRITAPEPIMDDINYSTTLTEQTARCYNALVCFDSSNNTLYKIDILKHYIVYGQSSNLFVNVNKIDLTLSKSTNYGVTWTEHGTKTLTWEEITGYTLSNYYQCDIFPTSSNKLYNAEISIAANGAIYFVISFNYSGNNYHANYGWSSTGDVTKLFDKGRYGYITSRYTENSTFVAYFGQYNSGLTSIYKLSIRPDGTLTYIKVISSTTISSIMLGADTSKIIYNPDDQLYYFICIQRSSIYVYALDSNKLDSATTTINIDNDKVYYEYSSNNGSSGSSNSIGYNDFYAASLVKYNNKVALTIMVDSTSSSGRHIYYSIISKGDTYIYNSNSIYGDVKGSFVIDTSYPRNNQYVIFMYKYINGSIQRYVYLLDDYPTLNELSNTSLPESFTLIHIYDDIYANKIFSFNKKYERSVITTDDNMYMIIDIVERTIRTNTTYSRPNISLYLSGLISGLSRCYSYIMINRPKKGVDL